VTCASSTRSPAPDTSSPPNTYLGWELLRRFEGCARPTWTVDVRGLLLWPGPSWGRMSTDEPWDYVVTPSS
jgi:hypothetical protein